MLRPLLIALTAVIASAAAASFPEVHVRQPLLRTEDRVRLAEARRLMATVGDSIWPGWSAAPFAVLLVTPEREFLIWHPRPSNDFVMVGYDSLLASEVHSRPRTFAPTLLATFPAVGGVPTIVVGTAEQTGRRSTAWVLTLAHEHFHQLQTSRPDYYPRVAALDLSGGDETGMWMLNYPFPYTSATVAAGFDTLARTVRSALRDTVRANQQRNAVRVTEARRALRSSLSPKDHRYLEFQVWQEGFARYTEYAVARMAAERHVPSDAFRALPDAEPFALVADRLYREIVETENASFANQRVAFYPVGAALGLWMDRVEPTWKQRYFRTMPSLDSLMNPR